jgi:murein DD-endopeptidase MepM/ murein hydrolase activator NlpD
MAGRVFVSIIVLSSAFVGATQAQIVEVARDVPKVAVESPKPPAPSTASATIEIAKPRATAPVAAETQKEIAHSAPAAAVQPTKPAMRVTAPVTVEAPKTIAHSAPAIATQPAQPAKLPAPPAKLTIEDMRRAGIIAAQRMKEEIHQTEPLPEPAVPHVVAASPPKQTLATVTRSVDRQETRPSREAEFPISFSPQTAFIKLADGFDFPVGRPDAQGYYRARGFRPGGHLGEDWDGVGGGDTDLGDPIYVIGDGVVVFARDCHQGWGNVIIVRHAFRDADGLHNIDSLYGHLQKIMVHRGQTVRRGEQIATLGNAHGLYDAHLHLEIRKNVEIGMSRTKFAQDYSNYYDPSQFILGHRHLQSSRTNYRVALNTFSQDARIRWDKLRNYSHAHSGGSSQTESASNLKKALATQNSQ